MSRAERSGEPESGARRRRRRPGDGLGVRDAIGQLTVLGTVLLAAATLLALFAERWWVAELFTHFRIQYLAGGAVLLAASLAARRRLPAVALLACMAINLVPVKGYLPFAATARSSPAVEPFRIISTNVLGKSTEATGLVALVEQVAPDALVVLELTPEFADGLGALAHHYPHRVVAPAEGAFGIGLWSRVPLADAAVFPLGATDAIRATLISNGAAVELVGVHLLPPTTEARAAERNAQLLRIAALVRDRPTGTVVCGDFNLTPYSPYFARLLETSRLRDVRGRRGLAWTWPAGMMPLALPIDHCLAGDGVGVEHVEVLGDIGSDHYPLLIEITAGRDG